MKKVIILIITIFVFLVCIDLTRIYNGNKPFLAVEVKLDNNDKKYSGIFFDVYNCSIYSAPQIKMKWNKYNCPVSSKDNEIKNNKKTAKLTLVGDLLFEQPFYDAVNNGDDKNEYFSLVKNYFLNDDLSIGNMEVVIGNDTLKPNGTGYNFCAPEYIGHLVNTIDFEVLGTANNHSYDRGSAGIHSTLDFFKNNTDIMTVGTYKNDEERNNLKVLNINDIKFGFLAYTYGTNQKASSDDVNLIGYYKDPATKTLTSEYKNKIKQEVEKLKKQSDVVIVLMHWGKEFTYEINKEQQELAYYLNSLGVDIIVGSHSHNIQPIDIIGENHQTLVYYSLGNFVSADDDVARTKKGYEEFDNAYQVGLLSTLEVVLENDEIKFENIDTDLVINYFDINMRNFKLIPFSLYNENYEKTHLRYSKGLTKEFINNTYINVIDDTYR